jgi:putative transposase
MSRKHYTPEQIIGKLREAEVALTQGQTAAQVCRTLGIAEQTSYRWRREYGGLKIEQAKRLRPWWHFTSHPQCQTKSDLDLLVFKAHS